MRRASVILATLLSLLVASCGGETTTAGGELPTAAPAPTVEGVEIEAAETEVQAEIVFIGIAAGQTVQVHALPGITQPLAGEVAPGTRIEKMTEEFETSDGLIWWQVRAGDMQGWIQPNVAYMGPASDITADVVATFDSNATYETAEDAALAIGDQIATDQGASDVIIVGRTEIEGRGSTTVTADVLGFGDDSLLGFRLLIASSSSTGYQPVSVTQFALCSRGITAEGLCL